MKDYKSADGESPATEKIVQGYKLTVKNSIMSAFSKEAFVVVKPK